MKETVFELLDNAYFENKYEFVLEAEPHFVAQDMCYCTEDFEDTDPELIVPFVEEWQDEVLNGRRNRS